MKKELNIAAILKDKPKGTKLWSPICGECKLHLIKMSNPEPIEVAHGNNGGIITLSKDGKYFLKGESILFPSKEMRSWEKFAWKKGDVLTTKTKSLIVVFDHFNATYESFVAKYSFCSYQEKNEDDAWNKEGENSYKTLCYSKVSDDEAKESIKKIEEHYGGTLNLETLEIEQPKPEFKDGDIVFVESPFIGIHTKSMIAILNKDTDDGCEFYLALCNKDCDGAVSLRTTPIILNRMQAKVVRPATDSEKQQLIAALAKENKVWNPDTKQIEDLPKKCEFEAFDFILVNDNGKDSLWFMYQFAFEFNKKGYKYYCMIGGRIFEANLYNFLPYNDSTKHLLGTTDEWKGGEG